MRVRTATSSGSFDPGLNLTSIVRVLVYATVGVSVAGAIGSSWLDLPVYDWLGLTPAALVGAGGSLPWIPALWQPLTYALVATSPFEVLITALTYGWFAGDLERAWGARLFLDRWLLLTLGVATATVVTALFVPEMRHETTIGPTYVVEGLAIAWGTTFPDRRIRIFWFVPVTGRVMVWLTVGMLALSAVWAGPSAFPWFVAPLTGAGLGWACGKTSLSFRRLWLHYEKRRLQRAIDRERTLH